MYDSYYVWYHIISNHIMLYIVPILTVHSVLYSSRKQWLHKSEYCVVLYASTLVLHWLAFIYKSLHGLLSSYVCTYSTSVWCTVLSQYSTDVAFKYAAPSSRNNVQRDLKLSELITMGKSREM